MTMLQIEKRVKVLETAVRRLTGRKASNGRKWYRADAGRFANDPVFDEIVKLGRAYRKTQGSRRRQK